LPLDLLLQVQGMVQQLDVWNNVLFAKIQVSKHGYVYLLVYGCMMRFQHDRKMAC
jgi:hypothetical protein